MASHTCRSFDFRNGPPGFMYSAEANTDCLACSEGTRALCDFLQTPTVQAKIERSEIVYSTDGTLEHAPDCSPEDDRPTPGCAACRQIMREFFGGSK